MHRSFLRCATNLYSCTIHELYQAAFLPFIRVLYSFSCGTYDTNAAIFEAEPPFKLDDLFDIMRAV